MKAEDTYGFNLYPKRPVTLIRGKGSKVWDERGTQYIDCGAGHGVANIGHCNPAVVAAIKKQSSRLLTCSTAFYNDCRAELLTRLASVAPAGLRRAFLCNSGTEAVEAALKFARFSTGRKNFVAASGGYHGRSMGALSVTFKPQFRKEFEPLIPGVSFAPFNDFEKLSQIVTDKTAAVILEVVQGEGGVRIASRDYLQRVRTLCDDSGALLIIDEIQSGCCRTGKFWACQHFGVTPDIMCVAKGIAGGVAMGATLCSDRIEVPVGKHGSTFGGNPLACAASAAALDFMVAEKLDEQSTQKGVYFRKHFGDYSAVREVRQLGLMIGIELKCAVQPYLQALLDNGVIALPAGKNTLRLLPPLIISEEELDQVNQALASVLGK